MNPSTASINGWMVASHEEPSEVAFLRPDGSKVLLNEDGTITELERE
jgi:hypothetical protein